MPAENTAETAPDGHLAPDQRAPSTPPRPPAPPRLPAAEAPAAVQQIMRTALLIRATWHGIVGAICIVVGIYFIATGINQLPDAGQADIQGGVISAVLGVVIGLPSFRRWKNTHR